MENEELLDYQFEYLLTLLGGSERVARLAYETGAFARSRKVESPADLLRLLLLWAVAGYSLEETAAVAAGAGIADVSDVALLKRFRRCREWLGALLTYAVGQNSATERFRVRLLDATTVSKPGSRGTDHRLHVSFCLNKRLIDSVELTDVKSGETFDRFAFERNDLVIGDRGYAHRSGIAKVASAGAFYIVRMPWQNIPLSTREGKPVALLTLLRTIPEAEAADIPVRVELPDGTSHDCRLVAIRKSEAAAEAARLKILNQKRKSGHTLDPRTLEAAGFFFVLTNLPSDVSANEVLELYGLRWQIEMKFKIMKSVAKLDKLPVRDSELAQSYVIAKLLGTLLIDQLMYQYESFSPWGYPIVEGATKPLAA